jgi:cell division protein FtsZ
MEKTPAFVRRNVELAQVKHSSESEAPNYTLSENTDKQIEIKSDNSYLHKDVD